MALDSPENRQILINIFPNLGLDGSFVIKSEKTTAYNCIAWAMGFDDRWVDHLPDNDIAKKKWWPDGVARDYNPETLVAAFEKLGFEKCNDDQEEAGYDKVALYKVSPLVNPITFQVIANEGWSHAARVLSANIYHSKIGSSFDIYHRSGDIFNGPFYGEVFQFMKRKVEDRIITERIKSEPSVITVPENILDIINTKLIK